MIRRHCRDTRGFTLMEILLAMTIFTSAILLMTTIFMSLNRSFSQATTRKELSEASQALAEDITRTIRMYGTNNPMGNCSDAEMSSGDFEESIKIGTTAYVWRTANEGSRGVWKGDCDGANFRLVDDRFTLRQLEVTIVNPPGVVNSSLFRIQGVLTSGNDDGLIPPAHEESWITDTDAGCQPVSGRNRNCSIERFNYIVNGRVQ